MYSVTVMVPVRIATLAEYQLVPSSSGRPSGCGVTRVYMYVLVRPMVGVAGSGLVFRRPYSIQKMPFMAT